MLFGFMIATATCLEYMKGWSVNDLSLMFGFVTAATTLGDFKFWRQMGPPSDMST